jgi:SAM-dependent methyltransferase
MDCNRATFEARDVVRFYSNSTKLQPPEVSIFEELAGELPAMRVLDIGVGGGRTTRHLASRVGSYVGIDSSAAMVEACRSSFGEMLRFEQCDMRDMGMFAQGSFDLALVSFNGLDYVCDEGRRKTLAEIRRVVRPGGVLCFSTHNLLAVPELFSLRLTLRPLEMFERLLKFIRLRLANERPERITQRSLAILNDGSYAFRARTHYIRPRTQIDHLRIAGFDDVRAYSLAEGREVRDSDLDHIEDPWVYFLCRSETN